MSESGRPCSTFVVLTTSSRHTDAQARVLALIFGMSSVGILHPRKLFEMLCACPSAEARARAALEFVRGSTGATAGFLLYHKSGELVLAASTRDRPPTAGLIAEAQRLWQEQLQPQHDDNATREIHEAMTADAPAPRTSWIGPNGEHFERRILSTNRPRWALVGLVMLRVADGRTLLPIRHAHIEAICEAVLRAGDVVPRTQ